MSSEVQAVTLEKDRGRPWGFWTTLGFTILVILASFVVQTVIAIAFLVVDVALNPGADFEGILLGLSSNGLLVSIATIASMVLCTPVILLFTALRKGFPTKEYLAARMASPRQLAYWLGITVVLIAVLDTITTLAQLPVSPDWVRNVYQTAYFDPILYFAILVAAPVFEEALFRGFMFEGIRVSRLGPVGAIFLTSLFWSLLHLQYDVYGIAYVFILGLLLGAARLRTNSLYLVMVMHSFASLISLIETVLSVNGVI